MNNSKSAILIALFTLGLANMCSDCAFARELLKGRIEQIFGADEDVSYLQELDARTEVLDKSILDRKLAPRKISAELKGFPLTLRGEWKGTVRVVEIDCTERYRKALPAEATVDEQFFRIGKEGIAKFRFFSQRNIVTMDTPVVEFAISKDEVRLFTGRPTIVFLETGNVTGPQWKSTSGQCDYTGKPVKNVVTLLSSSTAEQDTVSDSTIVHRVTRQVNKYYTEHVFQFEKVERFRLKVKIVEAQFGPDGKLWKRTLLEGDLH